MVKEGISEALKQSFKITQLKNVTVRGIIKTAEFKKQYSINNFK